MSTPQKRPPTRHYLQPTSDNRRYERQNGRQRGYPYRARTFVMSFGALRCELWLAAQTESGSDALGLGLWPGVWKIVIVGTGRAGGLIHRTGKLQAGHGPAAGLVGRAGPAAVGPRDSAHDGQPEAGSSFAAGPADVGWAGETLEGVRQEAGRESGAAVPDLDQQIPAVCAGGEHDGCSGGREPEGVVDEVVDRFPHAVGVDGGDQAGWCVHLA